MNTTTNHMDAERGRFLGVLDVENHVSGGPTGASQADFEFATHRFAAVADLRLGDHVIVGAAPKSERVFGVQLAWPGALLRTRRGIDGADLALCEDLDDTARIAQRFDCVVIGSGDHMFVEPVVRLNEAGVRTIVVSWARSLSKELRMAAAEVRLLTDVATGYGSLPPAA